MAIKPVPVFLPLAVLHRSVANRAPSSTLDPKAFASVFNASRASFTEETQFHPRSPCRTGVLRRISTKGFLSVTFPTMMRTSIMLVESSWHESSSKNHIDPPSGRGHSFAWYRTPILPSVSIFGPMITAQWYLGHMGHQSLGDVDDDALERLPHRDSHVFLAWHGRFAPTCVEGNIKTILV